MTVFKPLVYEIKETIADICFMWRLPHLWISNHYNRNCSPGVHRSAPRRVFFASLIPTDVDFS